MLNVHHLGTISYKEAFKMQTILQKRRINEEIPDTLLLLEHPTVITMGKRGEDCDIKAPQSLLHSKNIPIEYVNRGGQATLHSPGQLVGYLICHLYNKQKAVRQFIYNLENILIDTLSQWNIKASHHEKHRGVWVSHKKIASIGISIQHGVTMHGFALNINNDLQLFNLIIPCGINNLVMTSMNNELKNDTSFDNVANVFLRIFSTKQNYSTIIKS